MSDGLAGAAHQKGGAEGHARRDQFPTADEFRHGGGNRRLDIDEMNDGAGAKGLGLGNRLVKGPQRWRRAIDRHQQRSHVSRSCCPKVVLLDAHRHRKQGSVAPFDVLKESTANALTLVRSADVKPMNFD